MCGILGTFGLTFFSREEFQKGLEELKKRGPDDSGIFSDFLCTLGHRRLSIIDMATGHQPMTSSCGRFVIVFNGEIYNYKTLRSSLSDHYNFITNSDTEVIIAAYSVYGEKLVDYIEGMFAFAIYDKKDQLLFLARDPIGMKPLVYAYISDQFYFASEIKSLLPLLGTQLTIDQQSIYDFFCLKHIPAPATIFEDIKKLPAGHHLTIKLKNNNNILDDVPVRYWSAKQFDKDTRLLTPKLFRSHLIDTVKSHMVSDVPVGAFLSGGLDSSSIVWAMKQIRNDVKTFTVGFIHKPDDPDIIHARQVAKKLGTDHREVWIDLKEYSNAAEEVLSYIDEPFADPAMISNFLVSKEVVRDVKVSLGGDGGDELFFGYPIYRQIDWMRRRNFFFKNDNQSSLVLQKYFAYDESLVNQLLSIDSSQVSAKYIFNNTNNPVEKLLDLRQFDLEYSLPEYYLRKSDITSMMASLEVRTPFLYRPFINMVLSSAVRQHYFFGFGKLLLKRAMVGKLPTTVIFRPKKGFGRPTHQLFTPDTISEVYSVLGSLPWFNKKKLLYIITDYQKNQKNVSLLWRCLVFAYWFKKNQALINLT